MSAGPIERWIASNVFAILCWIAAAAALVFAADAHAPLWRMASAGLGALIVWFGWRIARQGSVRRRVAVLLERRFAQHGPSADALARFMGEPCLQAQALWLLTRWRRADLWVVAMHQHWRTSVVFYAHPTPEIEDALNFPTNEEAV